MHEFVKKLSEEELRALALEMAKFAAAWCPDRSYRQAELQAEAYYALTGREMEE